MQYLYILALIIISHLTFAENYVSIEDINNQKCIKSNGSPNHDIGKFPNQDNPNTFRVQNIKYCFPLKPLKNHIASSKAKTIGITLTGIPIRPGTADWYDSSSPRLHSRDKSSGWNLEAIRPFEKIFGLDENNAHVDRNGLYHYHGMPNKLINLNGSTLIGYAADGFEIHYLDSKIKSSWVLKKGIRSTEPFGLYDGSFLQDYTFENGFGNLDKCNGGKLGSKYVYFATTSFPFFPRCHWGDISNDFIRHGR